ncbi:MAG: hypothetical protein FJ190_06605 [Gammaproteobacteria bacterium]|nr:hypothetical protein [Gammaproteobacteria bacterium]
MNYLDRLKAQNSEKQASRVLPKLSKAPFSSYDSSQSVHISENEPKQEAVNDDSGMSYLQRLKAADSEKQAIKVLPKLPKGAFGSKDSRQSVHISENEPKQEAVNDDGSITETERAYLAGWLSHIGETDPEMISEFWHNIRHKQGAKNYFLNRAMSEASPDYRRHCHECQHFTKQSRYCTKLKSRQIDDIPRHCDEFIVELYL